MVQLIVTVISIALTALVVTVTVQYVPSGWTTTDETAKALRAGIKHLEAAVLAERKASAAPVNTYAAPQSLTGATFRPYVIVPKAPGGPGSGWSYGTTAAFGNAAFVCLTSTAVTKPMYRGFKRVKLSSYSDEQMTISTGGCGDTSDSPEPAFPAANVYVTYFFKWHG